eukprot:6649447-Alexandrium_andersonii.AAC.1
MAALGRGMAPQGLMAALRQPSGVAGVGAGQQLCRRSSRSSQVGFRSAAAAAAGWLTSIWLPMANASARG